MKIIIGLGNPGEKYKNTRHNAGFMAADKIREKYGFPDFEFSKKFNAEISVGNAHVRSGDKVLLAKPQTFMNNSGLTVQSILDFYKLAPENIVVIHDDIDLLIGQWKIATQSGSAGHNGVQDIIDKIGTKDFRRIRLGIANSDLRTKIDPSDFVLQKFSEKELEKIEGAIAEAIEEL